MTDTEKYCNKKVVFNREDVIIPETDWEESEELEEFDEDGIPFL